MVFAVFDLSLLTVLWTAAFYIYICCIITSFECTYVVILYVITVIFEKEHKGDESTDIKLLEILALWRWAQWASRVQH